MGTPIDPTDEFGLKDAYEAGVSNAHQGGIPSTGHWQGLVHVARAVLPEGYVAVPVEMARAVLEVVDSQSYELSLRSILVPSSTAIEDLRALLPTEEATR